MTNAFPCVLVRVLKFTLRVLANILDGCNKIADPQDGLVEDSDDELYNGMFLCRTSRKHFHLRTSRDP